MQPIKKKNKRIDAHGYSKIYERYFEKIRNGNLNVLELGSFYGNAAGAFFYYFKNSSIYSGDICPDLFRYKSQRLKNFYINSSSEISIKKDLIDNQRIFNVIIEDESHTLKDQIISLFMLFKILSPKGIFICEELDFPETRKDMNINNEYPDLKNILKEKDITVVVAADLLSLSLLKPPGEWGADVVVGTTQRFGIPLGYGGPHAAYFATSEKYKRNIPGRIIGVSEDTDGNQALRMALQTREQHIKREKATSNICTAQALLAIMAGMYGVYHGSYGLKAISTEIHSLTNLLSEGLKQLGYHQKNTNYFDTILISIGNVSMENIIAISEKHHINFNIIKDDLLSISLDEKDDLDSVRVILEVFATASSHSDYKNLINEVLESGIKSLTFDQNLLRKSEYMKHEIFNKFHSETEMMRYIKSLENKDFSLTTSMIPLGSCTMKLNAASELFPLSWPEFNNIHPFVPLNQVEGYQIIFKELEKMLCEVTGFDAMSLQPNSGAQGEYAGLMVIRAYHRSRGDSHRNICLIPSSAHGTNPASAVMAGMKVVVTPCDENGNIDVDVLKEKAIEHKDNLAALMITYPSTHGVFEEKITVINSIIHENGGQVYMDGANMNAQVGLTNPRIIGADVCHLNLHKTFAIPHGGGGPGVGPIGVVEHLKDFLPNSSLISMGGKSGMSISSAPWGSALASTISYAYIKMLGAEGLKKSTDIAILNANYIKAVSYTHLTLPTKRIV